MKKYNHNKIEKKWQKVWSAKKIYKTKDGGKKPKCYVLDMFPYPSGEGLHVGHPRGYIATDVYSRFKRMNGFNVLHPMGFDSFGLPAENYAIKNKIHPEVAIKKNIKRYKEQLEMLGFDYDWNREIITSDPDFYKWTQWIFLKMFEKGLAYESYEPINWCPSCKTGLANEDLDGDKCERCETKIEKKPMRQWVLKITDYAERMLEDLGELKNWPESIKESQRNWIGKSEGATVRFKLSADGRFFRSSGLSEQSSGPDTQKSSIGRESSHVEIFTTRIDTIFGVTYLVIAPEHKIISNLKSKISNLEEVEKYIAEVKNKSELQRTDLAKDKTGVELKGVKAINPANDEELPIWVADYVLGGYGTGAVMAVPAHDERDFEFAKKYNLPIKEVIAPYLKDDPKEDKKTEKRDVVVAIVKNSKDNTYLCLNWKTTEWKSFPAGGIEAGEVDLIDAAKREIKEETGYKNIKFIKQIGKSVYAEFYRPHKGSNVFAHFQYLLFDLENEEQTTVSEEEKKNHEIIWVKEKEIESFINVWSQKIIWKRYIQGDFAFCDDGIVTNSGTYTGLKSQEVREKMTKWLEDKKLGGRKINYKLKDWVFSRQRYWGEPIPLIHCEKCGVVAVPEKDLPVKLPKVKFYEPTDTGESPLAKMEKWVSVKCPKCDGKGKRETNTMPQWAGSSWYYLRYIDPKNKKALVDKKKEKYWSPVDMYVGGTEHATRHLIYARFWHKFLFDIGLVGNKEPFSSLKNQGLIGGSDGRKMSKRWGNVVNPEDVVNEYGADSLRLYEMFMGPFDQPIPWDTKNIIGVKRFLDRVWKLGDRVMLSSRNDKKGNSPGKHSPISLSVSLDYLLHKTIKKVSEDIENFHFNTTISSLMILLNEMEKEEKISKETYFIFLILLAPFAPHLAEEIWREIFGKNKSIHLEVWPKHDEKKMQGKLFKLIVQIDGKTRDFFEVESEISENEARVLTLKRENVKKWIANRQVAKIIYVPNKIINIVTRI